MKYLSCLENEKPIFVFTIERHEPSQDELLNDWEWRPNYDGNDAGELIHIIVKFNRYDDNLKKAESLFKSNEDYQSYIKAFEDAYDWVESEYHLYDKMIHSTGYDNDQQIIYDLQCKFANLILKYDAEVDGIIEEFEW
jgi:hypothetical protein